MIVRFARHIDCALHIPYRLHGRCIERGDHDLDARGVHQAQPFALKIREPGPKLLPRMPAEYLRVTERRLNGEMFLKRDLALHALCPRLRRDDAWCCAPDARKPPDWGGSGRCGGSWWSQAGSNR